MSQCPRCAMAKAPKFDGKPQSESDQCAIISVQTNRPLQCIGIEALLFTFTLHLKYLLSNGVLCLCPCAHMLCTKKILKHFLLEILENLNLYMNLRRWPDWAEGSHCFLYHISPWDSKDKKWLRNARSVSQNKTNQQTKSYMHNNRIVVQRNIKLHQDLLIRTLRCV